MTAEGPAEDTQSLIGALRDLDAAYRVAIARADDVIAALAAGDFTQVQVAVVAQDAARRAIMGLEGRRRALQMALAARIGEGDVSMQPGDPVPLSTFSRLLQLLPPHEAETLRAAHHDLLLTLHDLQSRNGVATMMLQNAQTVIKRLFRAQGTMIGYGPDGEPVLIGQPVRRRTVRRA